MSFAIDLLSGLTGFRDHLVVTAEELAKPALAAVEGHLARLEPLVRTNLLAAEEEGKAILHELYGSLVKETETELGVAPAAPAEPVPAAPAAPEPPVAAPSVPAPSPAAPVEPVAAPVAADPTQAPSTTEASSAPSSETSSASSTATDTPAPAAPVADAPPAQ